MAKLHGIFQWDGTFQGVTTVNSRAYGKHIRKARTSFTLSKEMMESSALMKQANVYAKVFKDSIDPYRRDFRDGMLWQRLVSLFKKQLKEHGKLDFSPLEDHDLNSFHPLNGIIGVVTTVIQDDTNLNVQISSAYTRDPTQGRADGYEQTLIVLFVDMDLQVKTFSESAFISFKPDAIAQQVSLVIPKGTKTAILVLKCNFSLAKKPMTLQKAMGMRVIKVVNLE